MADIQVYKRVIDYVGLNAKPIPERSLALFRELNPVLALLQGMGTDGAKLVSVDANGNLQVSLAGQAGLGAVAIETGTGTQAATAQINTAVNPASRGLVTTGALLLWNGSGYNGAQVATAAFLAAQTSAGTTMVAPPGNWSAVHQGGAGVQGSASKAAGGAGVRHVCTGIGFSAGSTVAPVLTALQVNLRDGATGAGTILASWLVVIAAATGQNIPPFGLSNLNLVGSANTAMTLEFNAALANLFEYVFLTGYDAS